jgi:hypothetical protein
MHIRIVFLVIGMMLSIILSIGIVSKIFAQLDDDQNNSFGLSKQSIIKAQGNTTELTANKTGFKGEDTVGLSGRSIEEAQGNTTELTANKTGFKGEDTVGLSGRSIEEANK